MSGPKSVLDKFNAIRFQQHLQSQGVTPKMVQDDMINKSQQVVQEELQKFKTQLSATQSQYRAISSDLANRVEALPLLDASQATMTQLSGQIAATHELESALTQAIAKSEAEVSGNGEQLAEARAKIQSLRDAINAPGGNSLQGPILALGARASVVAAGNGS